MVSWGEILFTVTAASYLLGRKELPKLGRFVGVFSGRSVGAILRAKQEFFDATKDHEIVKLQREFQKGIEELNEIRSELTSVGRMNRPHQPISTAPSPSSSSSSVSQRPTPAFVHAATASTPTSLAATSATDASSHAASAMPTTATAVRPSVASSDYIAALSDRNERRSDVASLALAELKLAEKGTYAPRVETLEGGADYVAASIVDSLLLDHVDGPRSSSTTASTSVDKKAPRA